MQRFVLGRTGLAGEVLLDADTFATALAHRDRAASARTWDDLAALRGGRDDLVDLLADTLDTDEVPESAWARPFDRKAFDLLFPAWDVAFPHREPPVGLPEALRDRYLTAEPTFLDGDVWSVREGQAEALVQALREAGFEVVRDDDGMNRAVGG